MEERVHLYVYDLSQGMARRLAPMFGLQVDAIYHTGIVVGGLEYYYGQGIQQDVPGATPFGRPIEVLDLGETHVPAEVREEFLMDLAQRFQPHHYSLLDNNCNHFSHELSHFLTGRGVPDRILKLPETVRNSPLGAMLVPYLNQVEAQVKAASVQGHTFRPTSLGPRAGSTPAVPAAVPSVPAVPSRSVATAATPSAAAVETSVVNGAATAGQAECVAANGSAAAPGDGSNLHGRLHEQKGSSSNAGTTDAVPASTNADGSAVVAVNGGGSSDPAAAKARFQERLRLEFDRVMAEGQHTPNEAASIALKRLLNR